MPSHSLSRRSFAAIAGGVLVAGGGPARLSAAPVVPIMLPRQATMEEGSFATEDGGLTVEWDPALFQVNEGISSDFSLYLNEGRAKGYSFNVSYIDYDWANVPETVDIAIDTWFSMGMKGVEIVETWTGDEGFAFFFTSDYGDYRGMRYFEYLYTPDSAFPWIRATFSLDVGPEGGDTSRTAEFLESLTLNGNAFPAFPTVDDLVALIDEGNL